MKYLTAAALLITCLISPLCAGAQGNQNRYSQVYFKQNGKITRLERDHGELKVERAPFSLVFYNHPYNEENGVCAVARLSACTDESEFFTVVSGVSKEEVRCFKLGTAITPDRSGTYEDIMINCEANHYLFYENEESRRLNLLERYDDDMLKLEFPVTHVFQLQRIPIENLLNVTIYLAMYVDRNGNKFIDDDELTKVALTF